MWQYHLHMQHPDLVSERVCQFLTQHVYSGCTSLEVALGECALAECAQKCSLVDYCYYGVIATKTCPSYISHEQPPLTFYQELVNLCVVSYNASHHNKTHHNTTADNANLEGNSLTENLITIAGQYLLLYTCVELLYLF